MKQIPLAPWLRKRLPVAGEVERVRRTLSRAGLRTVCQSAHCPNMFECFARGTATFLILGPNCTRRCRFRAGPQLLNRGDRGIQPFAHRHVIPREVSHRDS